MKILNFGSLNIDRVYSVDEFVRAGETISSLKMETYAGGKGLNQSIAAARAGAEVYHGGMIGEDGLFLKELLAENGVETSFIGVTGAQTGHAIIQVNAEGQNSILLFGGANRMIDREFADHVLGNFDRGDILILQNEISSLGYIVDRAWGKGMRIALNPSPIDQSIREIDMSRIEWLLLNEIEGESLTGESVPDEIISSLLERYQDLKIVLTLGKKGSVYADRDQKIIQPAIKTEAVDTTAAGDTFTGYFLSAVSRGLQVKDALLEASMASSIAVSRKGAAPSIPFMSEVAGKTRKIPVIMDCDPGHDDAIAIILACASDRLDVRAVTTTAGNQTIQKTTNNALRILSFIDRKIPVAMGAEKPLRRKLETAPEVHGDTGLDGPEIPEPSYEALNISAFELMARVVEESEDKVTLIPTGPLTNIAIFLLAYPHLKSRIERICLMGGSAAGGNWTAAAEFNILVDPEAADIVFRSGIPITMAGLDVTHKARLYPQDIDRIRKQGGRTAELVADLLDYFIKFHSDICGWDYAPLHDPCAAAWLINPEIFTSKRLNVQIDTDGEHTTGCTVTDFNNRLGLEPNTDVLFDVDREKLIDMLAEAVNKYD